MGGVLEDQSNKEQIVKLTCSSKKVSLYHKHCLIQWIRLKEECPLCRNQDILRTHMINTDAKETENSNLTVRRKILLKTFSNISDSTRS